MKQENVNFFPAETAICALIVIQHREDFTRGIVFVLA